MGIRVNGEYVSRYKFKKFHTLLSEFGGYYQSNPVIFSDSVSVHYGFVDIEQYNKFCKAWRMCTEDVVEVRKDQWWRILLRKLGFNYA